MMTAKMATKIQKQLERSFWCHVMFSGSGSLIIFSNIQDGFQDGLQITRLAISHSLEQLER